MSLASVNKINNLKVRAQLLKKARLFFEDLDILEVDCPILSPRASVDAHIDLIPATYSNQTPCFLHSSPEYGMKRLLSAGMPDIYQLSHVFRDGEHGKKHNPEFMMAEWYRKGVSFDVFIKEVVTFIQLFIEEKNIEYLSYRQAFFKYADLDYLTISISDLAKKAQSLGVTDSTDREYLLNCILALSVEPHLGKDAITVLHSYPAEQAALAKTKTVNGEQIAERFEIYYQGIELANGYHELTNAVEQEKRLKEANTQRQAMGKNSLPIDFYFIEALEKGLPESCGVAVGFDRLAMLHLQENDISEVMPFSWDIA